MGFIFQRGKVFVSASKSRSAALACKIKKYAFILLGQYPAACCGFAV